MNPHIHLYKVENFIEHKQILKDLIFKLPKTSIKRNDESILHTDYEMSKETIKEYRDYFCTEILPEYLENFSKKYNFSKVILTGIWFQVYGKDDFHNLHTHPQCNFTNVFYLELPTNCETEVYDLENNKSNLSVKEGNILTFPGFYKHCSPVNKSNNLKIVISFNTDVEV